MELGHFVFSHRPRTGRDAGRWRDKDGTSEYVACAFQRSTRSLRGKVPMVRSLLDVSRRMRVMLQSVEVECDFVRC